MPEIWLNYGTAEVVLDIRAENLDRKIDSNANDVLSDQEIESRISTLDFSRPMDVVVLDGSMSVRKIVSKILARCDQLSSSKPSLIAAGDSVLYAMRNDFQDKASRVYGLASSDLGKGLQEKKMMADVADTSSSGSYEKNHYAQDNKDDPASENEKNKLASNSAQNHAMPGSSEGKAPSTRDAFSYNSSQALQEDSYDSSNGYSIKTDYGIKNYSAPTNSTRNLVFVSEIEFDGLFGYNTVASKLLRMYGQRENDNGDDGGMGGKHGIGGNCMLKAYQTRQSNHPQPGGNDLGPMKVARDFVDSFEISAIETVGSSKGIVDMAVGHPSATMKISRSLYESGVLDGSEKQKVMVISPGKTGSGDTLESALNSLWNCCHGISQSQQQQQQKHGSLAVLLAESKYGVGSESLRRYIEGRLDIDSLQKPQEYISGMENLLFLNEIKKKIQIGLVSSLPNYYVKERLGMFAWNSMKSMMDYILKTHGNKQKVSVVSNGSRVFLS